MRKHQQTTAIDPDDIPVPPSNQIATVPHYGRLIPQKGTALPQCPTNLDLTTDKGKAALFNALNPGDLALDENGECMVVATHYVVYPDMSVDPETGEEKEFDRTVLIDSQGRTFRTTSAHAPHRVAAALDLFGPDRWQQGIKFQIRERRSRKTGRTYHDVRILVD